MTQIVVVGSSHIAALKKAVSSGMFRPRIRFHFVLARQEQYQPLVTEESCLNAQLQADIQTLLAEDPDTHIVATFGGNVHTTMSLSPDPRQSFDFTLPDRPGLPNIAGARRVPVSGVKAALRQRMLPVSITPLLALQNAVDAPLYQLDSPPTNPSESHITRNPGKYVEQIKEHGLSPAHFRLKFWLLHSEILRETCEKAGIVFCPVPAEMQDEEGFLAEAGWNPDPTHANAVYGRLVLQHIEKTVLAGA